MYATTKLSLAEIELTATACGFLTAKIDREDVGLLMRTTHAYREQVLNNGGLEAGIQTSISATHVVQNALDQTGAKSFGGRVSEIDRAGIVRHLLTSDALVVESPDGHVLMARYAVGALMQDAGFWAKSIGAPAEHGNRFSRITEQFGMCTGAQTADLNAIVEALAA